MVEVNGIGKSGARRTMVAWEQGASMWSTPLSLQRRNRFSTDDIIRKVYAQIQTLLFEILPLKGCG